MISPTHLGVLRKVYERLSRTHINWAITGSLGFALQGVPVEPHDIDIQADKPGVYAIERLFAEYVTRPVALSATSTIRSHFGALEIDGVKVELMGDIQMPDAGGACCAWGAWGEPADLNRHKRLVEIDGMRLPVLSLEYEYQAYVKLGRVETAERLRKWLHDRQT